MNRTLKRIVLLVAALVLLTFTLVVVSQTAQVVELADRVHPTFGGFVLWALLLLYLALLAAPVVLYLRLPRTLVAPAVGEGPEFEAHLVALKKRLAVNPRVAGMPLASRREVEAALAKLAADADEITRQAAATLFLSTAVSQSGRLDGLLVLAVQSKMVWQIAHVYHQRPTLSDLTQLYANVAGTAFVASQLDDIDISHQVEPVLSSTLGAAAGAIPGFQVAATLLVSSVLTGTANAFLTLRVGVITRRYCGSLVVADRRALRRAAAAEAAAMLGGIVRDGSAKVSRAIWQASKGRVEGAVSGVSEAARGAGRTMLSKLGLGKRAAAGGEAPVPHSVAPGQPLDPDGSQLP